MIETQDQLVLKLEGKDFLDQLGERKEAALVIGGELYDEAESFKNKWFLSVRYDFLRGALVVSSLLSWFLFCWCVVSIFLRKKDVVRMVFLAVAGWILYLCIFCWNFFYDFVLLVKMISSTDKVVNNFPDNVDFILVTNQEAIMCIWESFFLRGGLVWISGVLIMLIIGSLFYFSQKNIREHFQRGAL